MRLALLLLLVACSKEPLPDYPITPGGGNGIGSSFQYDAAVIDPDGGTMISGRVCLLNDARNLTSCAASGALGLTVTLGSATATTADNGSFTIMRPTTAALYWFVTGTGIEPSAIKFGSTLTLPALATLVYDDMLIATQAVVIGGQGAVIGRFTRASAAVTGATVIAQPLPDSEIYYDGASLTEWETDATGAFGVTWMPSIAGTSVSLTIAEGAKQTAVPNISLFADTITYVLAEIP